MSLAFVCGLLDPWVWWSVTGTSLCLYSKSYIAKSKYRYSFTHIHGHKQTIVRLNMPQHVAPPVCQSVLSYPSLPLPLCLFSGFHHYYFRRQSKVCQYYIEEYSGQNKFFTWGKQRFFLCFCVQGSFFLFFSLRSLSYVNSAFLKCIINLLALKTAVLFSVNQITKTLLIMTDVRKLCLFQVWFPVIYTSLTLCVSPH